jgi:hypothetical protein
MARRKARSETTPIYLGAVKQHQCGHFAIDHRVHSVWNQAKCADCYDGIALVSKDSFDRHGVCLAILDFCCGPDRDLTTFKRLRTSRTVWRAAGDSLQ